MSSAITPASIARASLRAMLLGAISRNSCRLHIHADGIVIEETKNGYDPVLYPEAHTTFDNSSVMKACGLLFKDLVQVVASGAGIKSDELPSGYLTWESELAALGEGSKMAVWPVNWFYRPATRRAPAALIAGIAGAETQAAGVGDMREAA